MSFAGSSCYGNAKCESMWARMKEEAIYGRHKTAQMSMNVVKSLVFRYYMGYWNHRRICHAIGGIAPTRKRAFVLSISKSCSVRNVQRGAACPSTPVSVRMLNPGRFMWYIIPSKTHGN